MLLAFFPSKNTLNVHENPQTLSSCVNDPSPVIPYVPVFGHQCRLQSFATDPGIRRFTTVTVFTQWDPHDRALCGSTGQHQSA